MSYDKAYVILNKRVGETPLECLRAWQTTEGDLEDVPLAYAGRLDPMASGKLLVLIGEECKVQEKYHGLDKAYTFEVLFGVRSDSGDVLGIIESETNPKIDEAMLSLTLARLVGEISLPFPIFSARTVAGKPLHTWAVEGRLGEITIPTKHSEIYDLSLLSLTTHTRQVIVETAKQKIDSLPEVTDPRKTLGNDFRRPVVRKSWNDFADNGHKEDIFHVAKISCIASSGTYMRSLAEEIAKHLDTVGLAFSIHRDEVGHYNKVAREWQERF